MTMTPAQKTSSRHSRRHGATRCACHSIGTGMDIRYASDATFSDTVAYRLSLEMAGWHRFGGSGWICQLLRKPGWHPNRMHSCVASHVSRIRK